MRDKYIELPTLPQPKDFEAWIREATRARKFDLDDYESQAASNPVVFSRTPQNPTDFIGTEKNGDIAIGAQSIFVATDNGVSLEWVEITGGSAATAHAALSGLSADDHPQYLNDSRLAQKNENQLRGVPLSATLSYASGRLSQVTKGGVTTSFTYNPDGTLATAADGSNTKTFSYSGGNLTAIAVT